MTAEQPTVRTGAEAIAAALGALDVSIVFTVPSAHNLPILDALRARDIALVACRHEQGVAHAADGYARSTGTLGVAVVSGGPGTANAMGGLYEAEFASSPVLLVTSQVDTAELGRGRGFVHEAESQAAMLATVCREVVTARPVDDLAATVLRLARTARTGRPRPVALEVPLDVQVRRAHGLSDHEIAADAVRPPARLEPVAADLDRAAAVLADAERPVVWAGGGVLRAGATDQLMMLADRWQAPVLTSREGRGSIPEDHPASLGAYPTLPSLTEWLRDCDVMLAVGTRFQMYPTAEWTLPIPSRLVHLDVDATSIGRTYPAEVAVVADAAVGLDELALRLPLLGRETQRRRAGHLDAGQAAASRARELVGRQAGADHLAIGRVVAEQRPADGVLVCDATVPAYVWGDRLVPILRPRTSIRSSAAGIGPGMALALGAAVGSTSHTVLIQGDGGFLLGVGELASAVQANARIVVCLFDDRGYGMLRDIAGSAEDPRFDLATPDFHDLALAFGARAARAGSVREFEVAFAAALEHDGPTLIHVDQTGLVPLRRNLGA